MYDDDLLNDYKAFYSELILTLDGGKALGKLNIGRPGGTGRYSFYYAEWFFKHVFEIYLANFCDENVLKQREDFIVGLLTEDKTISTEREQELRDGLRESASRS